MSTTATKASCANCQGNVEFPPEMSGELVPCPHCGQEMRLTAPAPNIAQPDEPLYRIRISNDEIGPYPLAGLRGLLADGVITLATPIVPADGGDWFPLGDLLPPEANSQTPSRPPPPPSSASRQPPPPPSSGRVAPPPPSRTSASSAPPPPPTHTLVTPTSSQPAASLSGTWRGLRAVLGAVITIGSIVSLAFYFYGGTNKGLSDTIQKSIAEEFAKTPALQGVVVGKVSLSDEGDKRTGTVVCRRGDKSFSLAVTVEVQSGGGGGGRFLLLKRDSKWEIAADEMVKLSANPYLADPAMRKAIAQFQAAIGAMQAEFEALGKDWQATFSGSKSDPQILASLRTTHLPRLQRLTAGVQGWPTPIPETQNLKSTYADYLARMTEGAKLLEQAIILKSEAKSKQAAAIFEQLPAIDKRMENDLKLFVKAVAPDMEEGQRMMKQVEVEMRGK